MASITITGDETLDMARHWLSTPPGAYLGSSYGSELKSLLQQPMTRSDATSVIAKLREDVPIFNVVDQVSVVFEPQRDSVDRARFGLSVMGAIVIASETPRLTRTPTGN